MNRAMLRALERLYAIFVRLYPKEFRRDYADEMTFVFSSSLRHAVDQRGRRALFLFLILAFIDLCLGVFNEHMREGKGDQTMTNTSPLAMAPAIGLLRRSPDRKKEYELRTGDQLIGTFYWPKTLGTSCVADIAGSSWRFSEQGFFKYQMTAHAANSEVATLTYTLNWMGSIGTIKHMDGRVFKLRWANAWGNRFALLGKPANGEEEELMTVNMNFYLLHTSANVTIQRALSDTTDGALIAMFGCYVAELAYQASSSGY